MAKQRIDYIDAMRGFTMILVVYSHVCNYCLGDAQMGFNDVFFLFRLPCFFFISGWLFQPVASRPFWPVTRHKFMVQIVPTVVFLFLLAGPSGFLHGLGAMKGGYWFTFVLFEFFVINMLSVRFCRRYGWWVALLVSVPAFSYAHYYNTLVSTRQIAPLLSNVLGFLSVALWRYYLFFFIGTWVRRHFDAFVALMDRPLAVTLVFAGFFLMAATPHTESLSVEFLRFSVSGLLGMFMVFSLFRKLYATRLPSQLSRFSPLQYIGTRTLDIYMLHYFFLPRFLLPYGDQLRSYGNPLLEFLVAMALSLAVVGLCLIASYVIRLSPFLGHYLFGVKYDKQRGAS